MLMFNDMTGSSMPASILSVPQQLVRLTESEENNPGGQITSYLKSSIPELAFYRYRDTWELFRRGDGKLYFFCVYNEKDCTEEDFRIALTATHFHLVNDIQHGREQRVKEFPLRSPPCHDEDLARQLAFSPICDLMRNISRNKDGVLKLMKFTKQSPTYWESELESKEIF